MPKQKLQKITLRYDNEMGYSNRVVDLISHMQSKDNWIPTIKNLITDGEKEDYLELSNSIYIL